MRRIIQVIIAVLIVAFTLHAIREVKIDNSRVQLKEIKLRNINAELDKLDQDYQQLEHDKAKTLKQKEAEIKKLKEREKQLEADLQAKRLLKQQEATAYAAESQSPVRTAVGGSCEDWINAAGITDKVNARELIRRESGCNPNEVNPYSGACGVAQELPCGKSGCSLGDGACSVKWMNSYVLQRYKSWANAVAFHNSNSWY